MSLARSSRGNCGRRCYDDRAFTTELDIAANAREQLGQIDRAALTCEPPLVSFLRRKQTLAREAEWVESRTQAMGNKVGWSRTK